jgi:hypothetical protein
VFSFFTIAVDVCLHEASKAKPSTIEKHVLTAIGDIPELTTSVVDVSADAILSSHCSRVQVTVPRRYALSGVPSWRAQYVVNVYKLNEDVGSGTFIVG